MEFEIMTKGNDVTYQIPEINFPTYQHYRDQAIALSEYIRSMEVTPENVKEMKKLLADTRKVTDRLNRKRIDIKKEILSGYDTFESQIKDITGIVDEADQELRSKVRVLDEMERQEKLAAIMKLWQKRAVQYDRIMAYIPGAFDKWLDQAFLNKSFSMKKVEENMAAWLEDVNKSIEAASAMGEEYLIEYIKIGDLAEAVASVNNNKLIRHHINDDKDEPETEPTKVFIVTGEKDITLTEMLLKTNNINYRTGD